MPEQEFQFAAPDGPTLHHIAERVLDRPLLVTPAAAEVVLQVLRNRLDPGAANRAPDNGTEANAFRGTRSRSSGRRGMSNAENGVAIIRVAGKLVNRGEWIGSYSGMVSYEGISAQIRDAKNDPEIHAVVLDLDSPGGEAGGMVGLALQVRELAAEKPTVAFVNDMACSAAYGIASQATEIVGTPTMSVGSIGVVMLHVDFSKQLADDGVKPTLIYKGAHKVDGNPFEPLPADVKARFEAECGDIYEEFVTLVAEGRGVDAETIRATEARVFTGAKAIEAGLADRIASVDEVIAGLSLSAGSANPNQPKGFEMSDKNTPTPEASNASTAQIEAARTEGYQAGFAAANTRMAAILALPEAEGREAQAQAIIADTDLSAEAAAKVLAAAPKASPQAAVTPPASIAARAGEEIGEGPVTEPKAEVKSIWGKAVANANAAHA